MVSPKEEQIPGALKYKWTTGCSTTHGTVSVKLPKGSIANVSPPSPEEKKRAEDKRKAKAESLRLKEAIKKAKEGTTL